MLREPLQSKRRKKTAIATRKPLPPPYKGLNGRDPLIAMAKEYASVLSNFWPNGTRLAVRAGSVDHVTGFADPVKTLATWQGVTGSPELYAFTDDGVFDATVAGVVGAADHPCTQGLVRTVQFRNSAGTFLFAVNATDDLMYYNGTAWTDVTTFTIGASSGGGSLATSGLTAVEVHQRRLWFVQKDTSDAWYLGVDLIGGDIERFRLGAQFSEGGYLVAMSTWSLDSGIGPEDLLVFLSSKGQAAVYAGLNPNSSSEWTLKGVYKLAEPIGQRPIGKIAGDCYVLTYSGIFSMNQVLAGGTEANSRLVTDRLGRIFTETAVAYGSVEGWQMQLFPRENMLLINAPTVAEVSAEQFAQNLQTGAWTVFTNWNALCWDQIGTALFYGGVTAVVKAWTGFDDNGTEIIAKGRQAYNPFGDQSANKHWHSAKPNLLYEGAVALGVGMDVDFKGEVAYQPAGTALAAGSIWDAGVWGTAVWGGFETVKKDWVTLPSWPGVYGAFRLRVIASLGKVEWASTDFLLETGDLL